MSYSVTNKLAIILCVATAVLVADTNEVQAQRRYGKSSQRIKRVQFESGGSGTRGTAPLVELPTAAVEGDAFPAMDSITPMVESPLEAPMDAVQSTVDNLPSGDVFYPEESYSDPIEPALDQSFGQPYDRAQISGPAPLYSTGTWFRNGSWFSQMDVLAWTRSDSRDGSSNPNAILARTNLLLQDQATGESYLFNEAVGHNFAPGARLSFGQFLGRDAGGRDHTWDFTFLGLFDWQDSRRFTSRTGGSLFSAFTAVNGNANAGPLTTSFFGADQADISYAADLNSGELNYRIRTRPGRDQMAMQPNGKWVRHAVGSNLRSILAGFRVMSFNEQVNYATQTAGATAEMETRLGDTGILDPNGVIPTNIEADAITGRYDVSANNDMIGFQIGGELEEKSDAFRFGLGGKIGGLFNFVDRRKVLQSINQVRMEGGAIISEELIPQTDANGDNIFDPVTGEQIFDTVTTFALDDSINRGAEKLTDENLAFLAEVNLFGTYQLRPNLHFRAGYDLMFLTGVSLAAENVQAFSGFGALNSTGSVFLHGGSVGFEATW